jgi:hypothetical protein
VTLSLLVALALSARPLSASELASVQERLGGRQAIAGQAFQTGELSPDTQYWFVPAEKNGDFLGLLLDPEKQPVGRLVLDANAHELLVSFDAVAFVDANEDGRADVLAVVLVKRDAGPARRKALLLMQTASGFTQDFETERAVTAALVERLSVARIRERLRPPLLSNVTVSCRSLTMPLAVSHEGLLAFSPGESPEVWNLMSGEAPPWMTPRLKTAIDHIEGPSCEWQRDENMPHGGSPSCTAPIQQLNDVLSGLPHAPAFADTAGELDAQAVSLHGSMLHLNSGVAGLKPGRIPLPSDCAVGDGQIVGAISSARELVIFLAPKDTPVPDSPYTDPPEAEECYRSGGTCVQDIVPITVDYPRVDLVTVRRAH